MNALSMPLSAPSTALASQVLKQLHKYGPLLLVIGLHIALFYGLRNGLVHQVAQTVSREIFATFVTIDPPPEPKPQPVPKTVPVVQKPVVRPRPKPVVLPEPSPQAITEEVPEEVPQEEEVSSEPPVDAAPTAAPSAPVVSATPKQISGVSYIRKPEPVYPPLDKRMGKEGTVRLRVLINEKGQAERVEIEESSGSLRMDDAARTAVMRAKFKPYVEDGRPMPAFAIIPINFTLR